MTNKMAKYMDTKERCLRCGKVLLDIRFDMNRNERIKFCSNYCENQWKKK